MNKEEITMMQCTLSAMKSAMDNIETCNKYKEANEIMVVINSNQIQEAIKGLRYNGTTNVQPSYLTGKKKNKAIDIIIESYKEFYEKMAKKLQDQIYDNNQPPPRPRPSQD